MLVVLLGVNDSFAFAVRVLGDLAIQNRAIGMRDAKTAPPAVVRVDVDHLRGWRRLFTVFAAARSLILRERHGKSLPWLRRAPERQIRSQTRQIFGVCAFGFSCANEILNLANPLANER